MTKEFVDELLPDDEIYGQLIYNPSNNRYQLYDFEFHCGDKLWVLVVDKTSGLQEWKRTRIEMGAEGWYLVGVYGYSQLAGLWAYI